MCPDGEGEVAKDDCPKECSTTSTSVVGEWTNGFCQTLSKDYDASKFFSLMDSKGRERHADSDLTAIRSVKFVCLNTARNYDAGSEKSDQLRKFFKAEDASMGIFLYEEDNCNADAIYNDIHSNGVTNWAAGSEPYFMRLVLPAAPCVSGTSFVTCKYDPEKAALAGDNEGLADYSKAGIVHPYIGLSVALLVFLSVHLQ